MKVTITKSAEESLEEIYLYKCEYSIKYADELLDKIYNFAIKNLSEFPELGRVYNKKKGLYRLVFSEGYNIYYTINGDDVFILYIIDGSISLNERLEDPNVTLPNN